MCRNTRDSIYKSMKPCGAISCIYLTLPSTAWGHHTLTLSISSCPHKLAGTTSFLSHVLILVCPPKFSKLSLFFSLSSMTSLHDYIIFSHPEQVYVTILHACKWRTECWLIPQPQNMESTCSRKGILYAFRHVWLHVLHTLYTRCRKSGAVGRGSVTKMLFI